MGWRTRDQASACAETWSSPKSNWHRILALGHDIENDLPSRRCSLTFQYHVRLSRIRELQESGRLETYALVANACTKSQAHLLAISKRKSIEAAVTDVLVILGFNVIQFALFELPLIGLLLMPDRRRRHHADVPGQDTFPVAYAIVPPYIVHVWETRLYWCTSQA